MTGNPFNAQITKRWLPVNAYIGGAEHAVLHLLYARFIWMVLFDKGFLPQELGDEPFPFLFSHGLIIKNGAKMSKSKGNVINPDEYINKYGVDVFRTYLMFLAPFDQGGDFRDSGIEGMKRFLNRVEKLYLDIENIFPDEQATRDLLSKLNKTIQKVTKDIKIFKYNTAISSIMELVNLMTDIKMSVIPAQAGTHKNDEWRFALATLSQLLAPFAPEMAENKWQDLGNEGSVHFSSWPKSDKSLIVEDIIDIIVQVNGKLRATLEVEKQDSEDQARIEDMAKSNKNVSKYIKDNQIRKVIFVRGKILNFVV